MSWLATPVHAPVLCFFTKFVFQYQNREDSGPFTGSNCELCAKGFYGNAITGTPDDCKPCPCPKDSGCIQLVDQSIVCTDCPEGYAGPKCEVSADRHFEDPTGQYGEPKECEECQCNGNVDVGNCNRTTGECIIQ